MHLTPTLLQGMSLKTFDASDQVVVICQLRAEFDPLEVEQKVYASGPLVVVVMVYASTPPVIEVIVSLGFLTAELTSFSSSDAEYASTFLKVDLNQHKISLYPCPQYNYM